MNSLRHKNKLQLDVSRKKLSAFFRGKDAFFRDPPEKLKPEKNSPERGGTRSGLRRGQEDDRIRVFHAFSPTAPAGVSG